MKGLSRSQRRLSPGRRRSGYEVAWMQDEPGASVLVSRTDDVVTLTLDRPARANALDRVTVARLDDAVDEAASAGDLSALVILGNGKNFCGGFDLTGLETSDEATLIVRFIEIETLLQKLYHAPFATIAWAQGNALGAGADIFAACEHRIAAPDARFRMPGWGFGVALGTRRLADRIGAAAARDVLSAGRTLDARQALHAGLATAVADTGLAPAMADVAPPLASNAGSDTPLADIIANARRLGPGARHLNALTVPDHRESDMAALVASLLREPSLKERMLTYARAVSERRRTPA
jgi:enoyl-CoA hydratase/carnithine racemase